MNRAKVISLALLLLLASSFDGRASGQEAQKTSGYLEVSGAKIYYEECGAGPNIVLLHDGLLHSNTWDGVWDALCKKYHAVRYDRRGYGRSEPPKAQYSAADDLYELLTHLKVRHAIVAGNSSGGALAIDFTLAHPEMVEALVLLGPVVQGMDTTSHFDERAQKNMAPLAKGDLKITAELWSKDKYVVAAGHEAARKKIYDTLIQSPQDLTHNQGLEISNRVPSLYRLQEIRVPTLILVGEFDIPDVHAESGAIQAGIPGAQREIVNNAGHLIQVELPEVFTERLGRFVDLQKRQGMKVPVDLLRTYSGEYDAAPTYPVIVTIEMKDGQLTLQTPGVPGLPLFAESESKFFMKAYELEIEFVKDASGKVVEAVIFMDGAAVKARRL